ncbi:MAG TPA: hypothetical protein VLE97_11305 [Gaiellaceae bacterium]|nr:hypothetical protein [Gaiellaceae bacterium]
MITRHTRHVGLVVLLLGFVALAGCGASARTTALRTSLVSLNGARDTARAASKEREKQIVNDCNPPTCTKEEGHARLDAWRELVDKAYTAIDDGYDAILAALVLDDAKSAIDAGTAIAKALALVKDMKNPAATPKPAAPAVPPAAATDKKETTP